MIFALFLEGKKKKKEGNPPGYFCEISTRTTPRKVSEWGRAPTRTAKRQEASLALLTEFCRKGSSWGIKGGPISVGMCGCCPDPLC